MTRRTIGLLILLPALRPCGVFAQNQELLLSRAGLLQMTPVERQQVCKEKRAELKQTLSYKALLEVCGSKSSLDEAGHSRPSTLGLSLGQNKQLQEIFGGLDAAAIPSYNASRQMFDLAGQDPQEQEKPPVPVETKQDGQQAPRTQPSKDDKEETQAPDPDEPPEPKNAKKPKLGKASKKDKKDPNKVGERGDVGEWSFYSRQKEIAIGAGLAQQVAREAKFVDDPVINEFVSRKIANIYKNSDICPHGKCFYQLEVKVIDDPNFNAFALPGGFVFVNTGFILKVKTEAEFAAVLGHELAHVALRHGVHNASKGLLAQIAATGAMIAVGGGPLAYPVYEGLNFGLPLAFLKFSRDQEKEADFLGVQNMYAAGYDPTRFADAFKDSETPKEKKTGKSSHVTIFSTHPSTPKRIEAADKEIADPAFHSKPSYVVDTTEFQKIKKRLRKIQNDKLRDQIKAQDNPLNADKPKLDRPKSADDKKKGPEDPSSDRPTITRHPDPPSN